MTETGALLTVISIFGVIILLGWIFGKDEPPTKPS